MFRVTNSARVVAGVGTAGYFHTRPRKEKDMELPTPAYTSGRFGGGKRPFHARIEALGVGVLRWPRLPPLTPWQLPFSVSLALNLHRVSPRQAIPRGLNHLHRAPTDD